MKLETNVFNIDGNINELLLDSNIVIYYHQNCPDGILSATIFNRHIINTQINSKCEYIAMHPNSFKKQDVKDKIVVFLDVCVSNHDIFDNIVKLSKHVIVIDHHDTYYNNISLFADNVKVSILYDDEHCGASLTWLAFNKDIPYPPFVLITWARDVFNWTLYPNSKMISLFLQHEGYYENKDEWVTLTSMLEKDSDDIQVICSEIDAFTDLVNDRLIKSIKQSINGQFKHGEDNYKIRVLNLNLMNDDKLSKLIKSDVGVELATIEEIDFAIMYLSLGKSISISGRVKESSDLNIAQIFAKYNGGGHRKASHALIPCKQFLELITY